MKALLQYVLVGTLSLGTLSGCATAPTIGSGLAGILQPNTSTSSPTDTATLLLTALDYARKGDTLTAVSTFMAWWAKADNKPLATLYLQQMAALYKGQAVEESLTETLRKLGQPVL